MIFFDQKLNENIRDDVGMGEAFVNMVRDRTGEVCPFDDAVISDSISHVGNMAVRTGRKITWDPLKEEIVGDPEASRMLARAMRPPWTL